MTFAQVLDFGMTCGESAGSASTPPRAFDFQQASALAATSRTTYLTLTDFPHIPELPMRPDIAALSEQIETTVALLRRRL